ncbi:hypothetical protein [Nitrospira lenta]|nr:hypothetical protein [Nitrospira lenta]
MLPKGLLVTDPHGQEFLLVPEERGAAAGYTLSVLQRHDDQWIRLEPHASRRLRESMLGALLEFFGNLCRILNHNSDGTHRIKKHAPSTRSQPPRTTTGKLREPS